LITQTPHCRLLEPDGTLLTSATCRIVAVGSIRKAVVRALDRPGRVVKRCVLEHLREIRIQLKDGVSLHGHVESVYYDPGQGRVCTVRLDSRAPVFAEGQLGEGDLRTARVAVRQPTAA